METVTQITGKMKKIISFVSLIVLLVLGLSVSAYADTLLSQYWGIGGDGAWHVYNADGTIRTDCIFCDDAVDPGRVEAWYLLDAAGNVISSAAVVDTKGRWYSCQPSGTGGPARMRVTNGTYDGIYMEFCQDQGGAFGSIINAEAISALSAKYPAPAVISDPHIVFSALFANSDPKGEDLPRSGELYHNPGYLSSSANFTISNSSANHTYVKFYSENGDLVSTVFIRKGERVKIFIPGGVYRMRQAFGDTWYGEDDVFGPAGKYWRCCINGSYDLPLKRAGVYVISTGSGGQAISKEAVDLGTF